MVGDSILSMVALLFLFSIPVALFMGSLLMQTIVNKWQHFDLFFKACTKGYVYSELMSDNKSASHSTILTSYEHLGVRLCAER